MPNDLIAHGTEIINTARQFGGSLGLTFIISFISGTIGEDTGDTLKYLSGVNNAFFASFLTAITGLFLSLLLGMIKKIISQ